MRAKARILYPRNIIAIPILFIHGVGGWLLGRGDYTIGVVFGSARALLQQRMVKEESDGLE